MDLEQQKIMLSLLVKNRDLMALCSGIIKPSYFDPLLKKTVTFVKTYFEKYKDIPKIEVVKAETGVELTNLDGVTKADVQYAAAELETFCRNNAVAEAIRSSVELLKKEDFGTIIENLKTATSTGLAKDDGTDYFNDPAARLEKQNSKEDRFSTGWAELDETIGDIGRGELLLFVAPSGGGKSITMLNQARNWLEQGKSGVYISLEMGEAVVSKRLDSMISKVSSANHEADVERIVKAVEIAREHYGKFYIKRMPENRTSSATIRSYITQLEQQHGFKPDFICVDYVDICGSSQRMMSDNMFIKDKHVTEELRALGFDFNSVMVSASQLGRASHEAENIGQQHIQGGMSKINTADYVVAVRQDEVSRNNGEIWFQVLKSRNSSGVGQKRMLRWDQNSLLISSLKGPPKNLPFTKKPRSTSDSFFKQLDDPESKK